MYRILYVDDEPGLLEIAKLFLERSGEFDVTTMTSVGEAVKSPDVLLFDVIVSDYQMPGMDGIAFLKTIREKTKDLPFILFTGKGREEIVVEAINNGADFYIQKGGEPKVQFVELAHKIRQAIRRRKAENALAENRDYLNQIFSSVKAGILVIDADTHRILDVNPTAAELMHDSRENIIGKECHRYVCPAERGKCPATDLGHPVDNSERVLITSDKKQVPIIKYVTSVMLSGKPALLETFIDNSERKQSEEALHLAYGALQKERRELQAAYEQIAAAEEELRGQYDELAKSNEHVRESEEKFRTLFEGANAAIFIMDRGKFLECNQRTLEIFGCSRDRLIGHSPREFSPEFQPDKRPSAEKAREMIDAAISGKPQVFEWVHLRCNGTPFFAEVSLNRFSFQGHYYLHAIVRDITERKEAEEKVKESDRMIRAVFDSTFQFTGLLSPEGILLDANRTALEFVGLSYHEVVGRPFWETPWWQGDEKRVQQLRQAVRDAAGGKFVRYEAGFESVSGAWIVTDFSLKPILSAEGSIIRLIAEARDVSGLRKAEGAYREANGKLSILASVTSHDINNQLTALDGFLELAKAEGENPKTTGEYLQKAQKAVERIRYQVGFLREYESLGSHTATWQDVLACARSSARELDFSGISLEVSRVSGLEIYADSLFPKVFFNLFDNALRYRGTKMTRITLSAEKSENALLIVCEDDGDGVAADEKEKIFERGFGKNTGLGLFLIRDILSLNGITIRETGMPGKGARFEILVPPGGWRKQRAGS